MQSEKEKAFLGLTQNAMARREYDKFDYIKIRITRLG
jgi:hypothetical protein